MKTLRDQIQKLFDLHTIALTRTEEGISFDTTVVNNYELINDLLTLVDQAVQEAIGPDALEMFVDQKGTPFIVNDTKQEIRGRWEDLKK